MKTTELTYKLSLKKIFRNSKSALIVNGGVLCKGGNSDKINIRPSQFIRQPCQYLCFFIHNLAMLILCQIDIVKILLSQNALYLGQAIVYMLAFINLNMQAFPQKYIFYNTNIATIMLSPRVLCYNVLSWMSVLLVVCQKEVQKSCPVCIIPGSISR